MDSCSRRCVCWCFSDGIIMAEKKNVSTTEDKKEKNSQAKKVTTGAWWKSAVADETSKPEPKVSKPRTRRPKKIGKSAPANTLKDNDAEESPALSEAKTKPARKPGRRKSPTKPTGSDLVSKKEAQASTAEDKEDTASLQQQASAPEIGNSAKVEAVEPPKKAPRKRRPSRGRKPAPKAEESASSASAASAEKGETTVETSAPVENASADNAETAETQQPAKVPRKRGRRKKTAPKKEEQSDSSQQGLEGQAVAANTALQDEQTAEVSAEETLSGDAKEKKTPRKRPGRKRKPASASKKSEQSLDDAETEKESDTTDSDRANKDKAEDQTGEKGADVPDTTVNETAAEKSKSQSRQDVKAKEDSKPEHKPVIKLLINAEEPEECRLALLEDGRLESIHVATSTRTQTKNNIYKARIVAIEPNLQAAFVEYGTEKNGFLPFSEIHPEYYKEVVSEKVQRFIDQHQWKKLSITDVIERGREVLVQVVKEEVGTKGANMTTYLSLPGRCVVLMPGSDSTGISRKISGEEQRSQLREYLLSMDIPVGIGWIVRTASIDITKAALSRDVNYLLKLWEDVKKKGQELNGVGLIYQDHDHVLRFLREHFDPDIQEILVDSQEALEQVASFIELLPSKQQKVKCKLHRGARPIFNQYSIEDQIESIYQPRVNLPSGGSIVIDPTEALVAIDVNSGSTQRGQNFEDTIFQANMEAGKELARQLRLRDLGGLIVVDFIDMRSKRNIREVERQVKVAMKRDKAKVDISRISKFGLMQISRQKLGAPIEAGNYRICENCKGRGVVRSVETLALYYLRRIHTGASRKMVTQIECRFPLDVAGYLLNNKRHELRELETKYNTEVVIVANPSLKPADHEILFHKSEKEEADKKQS